jgi:hypothetical protein
MYYSSTVESDHLHSTRDYLPTPKLNLSALTPNVLQAQSRNWSISTYNYSLWLWWQGFSKHGRKPRSPGINPKWGDMRFLTCPSVTETVYLTWLHSQVGTGPVRQQNITVEWPTEGMWNSSFNQCTLILATEHRSYGSEISWQRPSHRTPTILVAMRDSYIILKGAVSCPTPGAPYQPTVSKRSTTPVVETCIIMDSPTVITLWQKYLREYSSSANNA